MADLEVIANPAGDPAPFVDVAVTGDEPAGAVTVTVSRTAEGRTFKVRGMIDLPVIGAMAERDYEAPFDVQSTYQAQFFDAAGEPVGYSTKATTTLVALLRGVAWWHDPLDPSTAVRVVMGQGAAAELTRVDTSEVLQVQNRSVGVVIGGVRGGLTNLVLNCITLTREETARFDALFGGYDQIRAGVVCIRSAGPLQLPPVLFAHVATTVRRPREHLTDEQQISTWPVVGDEVAPPAPAIVRALLTYRDFEEFYSSYPEFEAAYPSYREASRDYSVKG